MSNYKLKFKDHKGADLGFLKIVNAKGINDGRMFVTGGTEKEGTTFSRTTYKKTDEIFYYKVEDESNIYLDEHTLGGVVFPESALLPVAFGSIHAWEITSNKRFGAVYLGKTAEFMGSARTEEQLKIEELNPGAIFCNLEMTSLFYTVELVVV
ncbi:MAG: hypothetical protein HRU40_21835 [Saprospiraceae bacterium]|nr:hypothetical protein [Saprospiraceae bacterium]